MGCLIDRQTFEQTNILTQTDRLKTIIDYHLHLLRYTQVVKYIHNSATIYNTINYLHIKSERNCKFSLAHENEKCVKKTILIDYTDVKIQ